MHIEIKAKDIEINLPLNQLVLIKRREINEEKHSAGVTGIMVEVSEEEYHNLKDMINKLTNRTVETSGTGLLHSSIAQE